MLTLVLRAAYFTIAKEAKKENLPFAGHVREAVRVIEASESGQKSIEHLIGVFPDSSSRDQQLGNAVLVRSRASSNHLPPRGAVETCGSEGKCPPVFSVRG
jgi:hypothetical protein